MLIKDYLNDLLVKTAADPYIESQQISFEERSPDAAYISGSITFIDSSKLHVKEFVIFKTDAATIIKYGYHYCDKRDRLIFRYDNAYDGKARKLATYPAHKHTYSGLLPAERPRFDELLREISSVIKIKMK